MRQPATPDLQRILSELSGQLEVKLDYCQRHAQKCDPDPIRGPQLSAERMRIHFLTAAATYRDCLDLVESVRRSWFPEEGTPMGFPLREKQQ